MTDADAVVANRARRSVAGATKAADEEVTMIVRHRPAVDATARGLGSAAIVPNPAATAAATRTVARAGIDPDASVSGLVSDAHSGVVLTFATAAMHANRGAATYRFVFDYRDGNAVSLYVGR